MHLELFWIQGKILFQDQRLLVALLTLFLLVWTCLYQVWLSFMANLVSSRHIE